MLVICKRRARAAGSLHPLVVLLSGAPTPLSGSPPTALEASERVVRGWSGEVVTLLDVLDEAGMGGLPAQEVLGDGTGGRLVPGEQENEDAFVLLDGQGPGGQVQVAADSLGDIVDGNALIADGVEHRARGGLLDGQPV